MADTTRKQKARAALGSSAHPDDEQHSKHGLIVAALETLRGEVGRGKVGRGGVGRGETGVMKAGRGCGHRALIPSYATTTLPTPVPASSDAAQAAVPRDQVFQGSLAPPECATSDHPDEIAIWIDWCCLDQDASSIQVASSGQAGQRHGARSSHVSSQLQCVAALVASCDVVLTPVSDPAHASWDYPEAWAPHTGVSQVSQAAAAGATPTCTGRGEGRLIGRTLEQKAAYSAGYRPQGQSSPLEQYAAPGWVAYWGRAWCGTEALLSQARHLVITPWHGTVPRPHRHRRSGNGTSSSSPDVIMSAGAARYGLPAARAPSARYARDTACPRPPPSPTLRHQGTLGYGTTV